jgi:hypothetical protein
LLIAWRVDVGKIPDNGFSFSLLSFWRRFLTTFLFVTLILTSISVTNDSPVLTEAEAARWGPPFEISTDVGQTFMLDSAGGIAAGNDGQIHTVWVDQGHLYYRNFKWGVWQPQIRLSNSPGVRGGHADVAEENGLVYAIWAWEVNLDYRIYFKLFDGTSWGPQLDVAGAGGQYRGHPSITAENGFAYAVWADGRDGDSDVYFARFDGTAWIDRHEISNDIADLHIWYPDLAVEGGEIHVVWHACVSGECDVYYRFFDGTLWHPIELVSDDDMGLTPVDHEGPEVAVENGEVYVLWMLYSPSDYGLFLRRKTGGSWETIERAGWFPAMRRCVGSHLAAENEHVYIAWSSSQVGESGNVHYRHFNGIFWEPVEKATDYIYPESGHPQGTTGIAVRNGTIHLLYSWRLSGGMGTDDSDVFYISRSPHVSLYPPRNLRTSVSGMGDIRLDWEPPMVSSVDYYLIYRSTDQRSFDFQRPVHNTSTDPFPLGTNWTDIGADNASSPREYYYVVRAANSLGMISSTSNTAGKWRNEFSAGLNAFSLPLEPYEERNVSWYAGNIPNAIFIRWMDTAGHWVTHSTGMGEGSNDSPTVLGEAYELCLATNSRFTFTGFPASMIRFDEGLGDNVDFRTSLTADANGEHVVLNWDSTVGAYEYWVFKSGRRNELHTPSSYPVVRLPLGTTSWTDENATRSEGEAYYVVLPISPLGEYGSSTYSIGVIGVEFEQGSDTFALPLKSADSNSLDWYCDAIPDVAGMAYMIFELWKYHANEMPQGVYDVEVLQGEGYQISIDGPSSKFTFVGY